MRSRFGLFIFLLTLFLLASCGSDDDPAGPGGDDTDATAPNVVSDLQIHSYDESTAAVIWTAPGDDAAEGTATAYQIGYSAQPITEATWSGCTMVATCPTPTPAGSEQFVDIDTPPTPDIYVALKAVDEAGNWSQLSNVAHGHIAGVFDIVQLTFDGTNGSPCLDDGYVTWVGQHEAGGQEIWMANINGVSATPTRLTDNGGLKMHPSSHGSEKIAWMGREGTGFDWEVFVYSRYSVPRYSAYTDNEHHDWFPVLAGAGDFAWNSGPTVRYFDGLTHNDFPISDGCCPNPVYSNGQPYADDHTVVWGVYEPGTGNPPRVKMWNGVVDDITDVVGSSAHNFSMDDGKMAYEWGELIRFWDGATVVDVGVGLDPSLDDGWIAFEKRDGLYSEIFLWDGVNMLQITDNDYPDYDPSLSGDRLAWSARPLGEGGPYQIFYTRLPER